MNQYYFLGGFLPPIDLHNHPSLSWDSLLQVLKENLSPSHWHQLGQVRRIIDLDNMLLRWMNKGIDHHGFWSASELDDHLAVHDRAESPIVQWLDDHSDLASRFAEIELLRVNLMMYMRDKPNVVGKYYELRWILEMALLALRKHFFGEELNEALAQSLKQDEIAQDMFKGPDYSWYFQKKEFNQLKEIFVHSSHAPKGFQEAYSKWLCSYWDCLNPNEENFSLEAIVIYVLKFIEIDRWWHQDIKKAQTLIFPEMDERKTLNVEK